jgi:hypothetical protein
MSKFIEGIEKLNSIRWQNVGNEYTVDGKIKLGQKWQSHKSKDFTNLHGLGNLGNYHK